MTANPEIVDIINGLSNGLFWDGSKEGEFTHHTRTVKAACDIFTETAVYP